MRAPHPIGYLGGNYAENLEQNNWGASILTALTDRLAVLEPGCSVGFAPGLDDLGSTDERGFPAAKQARLQSNRNPSSARNSWMI